MSKNLSKLFYPNSIAIFGVSSNSLKIGSVIFNNLKSSGFKGEIFPVNSKYDQIFDTKCYKSLDTIKSEVDLVIMAIPAQYYKDVIEDCYKKGVHNLVIISAGFKEIGGNGIELEEELVKLASKYNINILGPNCLGLIVSKSKMNASFSAESLIDGDIAFISQSGAICTTFLDIAKKNNLGFSHFISLGNEAVINENEVLENLLGDKSIKVLAGYLEGYSNGRELLMMKNRLGVEKPIILLSPGATEQAQSAIRSHTGSLTSGDNVINAGFEKAGIVRADSINELYSLIMSFDRSRLPDGNKVAILSNAGGVGVIATDILISEGLNIAILTEETKNSLKEILPSEASVKNPIDIVGDAKEDRYEEALNILENASEVDSIIIILTPQLVTQIEETSKLLINFIKTSKKTIIPIFLGSDYVGSGIERLNDNRICIFNDLNLAISSLKKLTSYSKFVKTQRDKSFKVDDLTNIRKINLLKKNKKDDGFKTPLDQEIVIELLKEFHLKIPKTKIINSFEDAKKFAYTIGFPVVLKSAEAEILHKTELKAVFVNIKNEEQLKLKYDELDKNISKATNKKKNLFLVQEMVKNGLELFLGSKRDGGIDVYTKESKSGFGHIILFGTGGVYTQVYNDINYKLLPLNDSEINDLINSVKVSKIIDGFRGEDKFARNKLIEVINKLQSLLITYPEISEIDINPVILTEDECYLVDVKILVG